MENTDSVVLSKGETHLFSDTLCSGEGGLNKKLIIKSRVAAAGDRNNDKIITCNICRNNGFPREAIDFQKVSGRVLSDGTNEVKGWVIRDYFSGNKHVHKQRRV